MDIFNRLDKLIIFFVIYSFASICFFKLLPYTFPFIIALILSYILRKPTIYLIRRFKLKPALSALLTTLAFFFTFMLFFLLGIHALFLEIINITNNSKLYIYNTSNFIIDSIYKLQSYYKSLNSDIISYIEASLFKIWSNVVSQFAELSINSVHQVFSVLSAIPYIAMILIFTLISTYFFTKDFSSRSASSFVTEIFPNQSNKIFTVFNASKKMLLGYIASSLLLVLMSFVMTFVGFSFFKVKYALLLSIIASILDLLPVVGMPIIYFPIIFIYILHKDYYTGIGLICLYLLVLITRQILEPKIMSSYLNLHPVAVICAIFIGIKLNGFYGIFFCIFLLISYEICKKVDLL
jgi:sporulation integral membrane protein YtvI